MDILKEFYSNEAMREAVKTFLIEQLRETAVERVFDKKAVAGIYEARKVIDMGFNTLEEKYGIIPKPNIESSR